MLTRLWSAISRVIDGVTAVADSLFDLAATFREGNAGVRDRLGLDAAPPAEQLPQPARNGRRPKPAA